jgi:hypothetical protein
MLLLSTAVVLALGLASVGCQGTGRDTERDTDTDSDFDTSTLDNLPCDPGEVWCFQNAVAICDDDGYTWNPQEDCGPLGLVCAAGECVDISAECALAINERSYVGCEYWTTTLVNVLDDPVGFYFAVALANNGSDPAQVNITDDGFVNNDYTVPAGDMIVIEDLPWIMAILDVGTSGDDNWATRKMNNAAYHITSDRPITAYQFNPLHYCIGACADLDLDFSYTNDASLLLPAHVYRDEYIGLSRGNLTLDMDFYGLRYSPSYLAVVGTGDENAVIEVELTAYTRASDFNSNEILPARTPGSKLEVTLRPYEVIQIVTDGMSQCLNPVLCDEYYNRYCCEPTAQYDLTGSVVRALSGPSPAVFAGNSCSFVPYDKFACDHLEQQMFPLETWGRAYHCAHNITQAPAEPTVWRIVSGAASNQINFDPSTVHSTVVLDAGEFIEFESLEDFSVEGTDRFAVVQYMVGQNYTSSTSPPPYGDPAMALAVPVEQYRTEYTFLAPDTYVYNYLTVIHRDNDTPVLDGNGISGDTAMISGGYSRTNLSISGGIHRIVSGSPFAIMVYGVGRYTSYMYPGGLDLRKVHIPVQ